jgi:glyoxylase-like metal-dependent hydrolase (beta-lactamase superfamily II)
MNSKLALTLTSLTFIAILICCRQTEEYQVFALKYAEAGKFPAAGPVIGAGQNDSVDLVYMFWLLKDPKGKNILVDAGFIDSTHTTKNFLRPDSVLLQLNIPPQEISDIIITHPHYDHIGGINLFPNAVIWMHQDDYEYFIGPAWEKGGVSTGFNKTDVKNMLTIQSLGRLKLIKGDDIEFMPGIKAFTGSKHTFQNIYLLVNANSKKNKILLASDAIWFNLNLEKELPISLCLDTASYVKAIRRMKTLVADQDLIIPGHDNKIFLKFPKVNDRTVRIAEVN